MTTAYLIDWDNVHQNGLNFIENRLQPNDEIYIFKKKSDKVYPKNDTISNPIHLLEFNHEGDQFIDHMIIFWCGAHAQMTTHTTFTTVSYDTGYDSLKALNNQFPINFKRIAPPQPKSSKQSQSFNIEDELNVLLTPKRRKAIYDYLQQNQSNSNKELAKFLRGLLGSKNQNKAKQLSQYIHNHLNEFLTPIDYAKATKSVPIAPTTINLLTVLTPKKLDALSIFLNKKSNQTYGNLNKYLNTILKEKDKHQASYLALYISQNIKQFL